MARDGVQLREVNVLNKFFFTPTAHEASIKVLADFCHMKSKTLNDYYKESLSNYRSWDQLSYADEYMYFKDNFGESISIDETALSNGELYTIVTNKNSHGKRG